MNIKFFGILSLLGSVLVAYAFGQDRVEIEQTRAGIQAKRTIIVSQALDFTEDEEGPFWQLYKEYRAEMAQTEDFETDLLLKLADEGYAPDDDVALKLLEDALRLDRERSAIVRKYVDRLKNILPGKKVARFFQLEAQMDAIVDYELATQVPLVE